MTRRKASAPSGLTGFFSTFIVILSSLILGGALAYWYLNKKAPGSVSPPKLEDLTNLNLEDVHVRLPGVLSPRAKVPKIIYLNREGALLTHGMDDSAKNIASLAPRALGTLNFPAYSGSLSRWRSLVKCVQQKFAAFDVRVVDQRPVEPGYIMVMVGGSSSMLKGHTKHTHAAGLAPFNSRVIPDAVVFAFSSAMKNSTTATCETIGMEAAHAYGLDHAMHCSDLMTYLKRCGSRKFLNRDLKCGEYRARTCANGDKTQNSYTFLMKLLGPKKR